MKPGQARAPGLPYHGQDDAAVPPPTGKIHLTGLNMRIEGSLDFKATAKEKTYEIPGSSLEKIIKLMEASREITPSSLRKRSRPCRNSYQPEPDTRRHFFSTANPPFRNDLKSLFFKSPQGLAGMVRKNPSPEKNPKGNLILPAQSI